MKRLVYYQTRDGKIPFERWREGIRDTRTQHRIDDRLDRVATGNFGDHKTVGGGVKELRLSFGPGYRIYYGEHDDQIVVLLCGGDKGGQADDISSAQAYWRDYLERK